MKLVAHYPRYIIKPLVIITITCSSFGIVLTDLPLAIDRILYLFVSKLIKYDHHVSVYVCYRTAFRKSWEA